MTDLEVQTGPGFHCVHLGPLEGLARFSFGHPAVAKSIPGKLFLKEPLGLTGAEVSLNVAPPGRAVPFLHRHKRNEELYIFVRGRGQVMVDDELIEVAEGSVIRMSPAAVRTWRNHSDEDLVYIVIQYRADPPIGGTTSDGEGVSGDPRWPANREA